MSSHLRMSWSAGRPSPSTVGSWASWQPPTVATDALSELAQQGVTLRQLAGVAGADHAHEDRVTAALGNGHAQLQRGEGPPAALRERTQVGLSAVARGRRDLRQQCQVVVQRHVVWRERRRAGALSDWAAVGATFGQLWGRLLDRKLGLNVVCRCQASDPDAQDQARRRVAHVIAAMAVSLEV